MGEGRAVSSGPAPLRLSAHRTRNGTVRLVVAGEIDMATVCPLRDRMRAILGDDRLRRLLVDFRDVTFMDASGVGALSAALRVAADRRVELSVVNCRRSVLRVLEITGVDKPLGATGLEPARTTAAS